MNIEKIKKGLKINSKSLNISTFNLGLKSSNKGASIPMQKRWKKLSIPKKIVKRSLNLDTDRDGVPNRWDCRPKNRFRQDTNVRDLPLSEARNLLQNLLNYHRRMNNDTNLDVFRSGGGYWNDNGNIKPHCRHTWQMRIVRRKNG